MNATVTAGSDPMAWRRDSFPAAADFSIELTARDRVEIVAAIRKIRDTGRLVPAHALGRADFPFLELGARLERAAAEVREGRGFALLRGLPLDGLSLEDFVVAVWGIGMHFGHALSQNAQGELIGHVIDATAEDATPRMYRSNLELRLHNDVTAMVALACWHRSQSGGVTMLASARTIRDEIERRAPHLLEPL